MKVRIVIIMAVFSALCMPAFSENPLMMPAPPPFSANHAAQALIIGPGDSMTAPKNITGKVILITNLPKDIQASEVELFVDSNSVGKANARPYKIELDCSTFSSGEHVIKAVAKSSSSEQVWSASTKVRIDSDSSPAAGPRDVTPAEPLKKSDTASFEPTNRPGIPMEPNATYTSDKHGFTIMYPQGWTVKDETSEMNGKKSSDDLWLVIGAPPVVVNIHCKQLAPGTSVQVFAKYNPYVQKWERRAVADSPAFVTTDGKPELGRVVHRVIFIKNGCSWMANCIDTSGGDSRKTAKLLEDMLETIHMTGPQVNITPVK
ncbi:MAG: hypothetical protein ABFD83_06675 [Armatimonadota bacterium]